MQEYEVVTILENLQFTNKNEWEISRLMAFINAKCQGVKQIHKPSDLFVLPWEKDLKLDVEISNEDKLRLENKSKEIINKLKNKKNGK